VPALLAAVAALPSLCATTTLRSVLGAVRSVRALAVAGGSAERRLVLDRLAGAVPPGQALLAALRGLAESDSVTAQDVAHAWTALECARALAGCGAPPRPAAVRHAVVVARAVLEDAARVFDAHTGRATREHPGGVLARAHLAAACLRVARALDGAVALEHAGPSRLARDLHLLETVARIERRDAVATEVGLLRVELTE
jgi:hypothetical protein